MGTNVFSGLEPRKGLDQILLIVGGKVLNTKDFYTNEKSMDETIKLMVGVHESLYFLGYVRYVAECLGRVPPPNIPFNCQHREVELDNR